MDPITDTQRLDWLLAHGNHEFDRDRQGTYLKFWMGACESNSTPGYYIARGNTQRACINAAIVGNTELIY